MDDAKPIRYSLLIHEGSFQNDCAGVDSLSPFVPLCVGDYIDPKYALLANDLKPGQAYRVKAIKHGFQDLGKHIQQYIDVCVEVTQLP